MTDNNNSQIVPAPVNATPVALANFSDRGTVGELADRLLFMAQGTQKLTKSEAWALAQIAIAHDLDPFNGEIWPIGSADGPKSITVGIKGLRKHARRQMNREGGTYWTEIMQIKPSEVGAAENAVVYRCIIRDTVTMQAYGKSINILTTAGVPYQAAIDMVGRAPQVVGVGIARPDERSKMEIHDRARKRAEAGALKQRFDIEFAGAQSSADVDEPDIIASAAEYAQEETTQQAVITSNSGKNEQQIMTELGFNN